MQVNSHRHQIRWEKLSPSPRRAVRYFMLLRRMSLECDGPMFVPDSHFERINLNKVVIGDTVEGDAFTHTPSGGMP